MSDLEQMIENLDSSQLDFIEGVVLKLASVKASKWCGDLVVRVRRNAGGAGESFCDHSERLTSKRKRRTRSRGL